MSRRVAVRWWGVVAFLGVAVGLLPSSAAAFSTIPDPSCADGEYVRWRGGPTPWHLNEKGAKDLEFTQVEAIFQGAFAAWAEPCCSGATSRYLGTTKRKLHAPQQENVIAFEGESWPPEAGSSRGVIGVTIFFSNGRCGFRNAAILFNEIDYRYFDTDQDLEKMDVDLRFVGAHEVGHWLGIGHSEDPGSLMRLKYTSDLPYEGLNADDVEGICTLYPGSCESCGSNEDCPAGSACRESACVASECRDTIDCPLGTICDDELCVEGCRSHVECTGGGRCLEGSCVPSLTRCENHVDCAEDESCVGRFCRQQPEACSTCKVCWLDTDCGLHEICISADRPGTPGFCTNECATDRDCVGDAVCRRPQGAPNPFCLDPISGNPNAFCNPGYSCSVAEPGPELGCALLGSDCTNGSFGCGGRADTCIDLEDGPKCSCTCRSDAACGEGARCVVDPSTNLESCFPGETLLPCEDSFCVPGQICLEDGCGPDPCAGISCEEGASCVDGQCVKPPSKPRAKASSCSSAAGGPGWIGWLIGASMLRGLSRRRPA